MKHRTEHQAAPLRPAVRALSVALLMLAALIGGAFPSHAEASASAHPQPGAAGPVVPAACPFHASSPQDSQGRPGGCGTETHVCTPSTSPPIPPVLPAPLGSFVPPWLVDPDGAGPAFAPAASAVPTDLTDLCVSRT
ncbi:hypothetical protein [Yinghuangia soli]|uniref:Secreted protein n=1 Tax=Yinghuangia soli TaxID=2908204 RepID=A0AA41PZX1_9ACTN|nr:hypothetical protein [Yinghuangia soli]MCF2529009.1 hypothetical protein [Yinghuangia soli]